MFNQEDQLPDHNTLWKAHSPICSWEAQLAERFIDRVRPFQFTVAANRPNCCQATVDFVPAYSLNVVHLAKREISHSEMQGKIVAVYCA